MYQGKSLTIFGVKVVTSPYVEEGKIYIVQGAGGEKNILVKDTKELINSVTTTGTNQLETPITLQSISKMLSEFDEKMGIKPLPMTPVLTADKAASSSAGIQTSNYGHGYIDEILAELKQIESGTLSVNEFREKMRLPKSEEKKKSIDSILDTNRSVTPSE